MARTAHGGHSGWSLHSSLRIAGCGAWPAWLHAPRSSVLPATCGETYSAISPAMRRDTLRSVQEVVDDGLTGFIVEDEEGAIGGFDRLSQPSREKIRRRFEQRFTARRMAFELPCRLSQPDGPGRASPQTDRRSPSSTRP